MTFFRERLQFFGEGLRFYREWLNSEGLRLYSGGVEIFFGEGGGERVKNIEGGGVKYFQGVCEIFRGLRNILGD